MALSKGQIQVLIHINILREDRIGVIYLLSGRKSNEMEFGVLRCLEKMKMKEDLGVDLRWLVVGLVMVGNPCRGLEPELELWSCIETNPLFLPL